MIIVGADTETTGVDTEIDQIVETGLAVYDTEAKQFLALHSDLYKTTKWSAEAEEVHHIKQSSADKGYGDEFNPWDQIRQYNPVVIVAHNAEFDKALMVKRWPIFNSLPWICSKRDLPHDKVIKGFSCSKLQHLAVDYGLEPGQRHRALFDAMLCCEIASRHDMESVVGRCKEPKFTVKAWYPEKPDFSDKDFNLQKEYLKKAGFRWDGKFWIKDAVPESLVKKYLTLATAKSKWQASETPM
jgi:DNA polymerase-3 subunit epsilon